MRALPPTQPLKQNCWSSQPSKPHSPTSLSKSILSLVPSQIASNLGSFPNLKQLTFSEHVASVARLCCYALFNIRKIMSVLIQQATQLLVQTMVIICLHYCKALLTGLRARVITPLQMVENVAASPVFNLLKRARHPSVH